jgi:hypothetical protein
MQLAECVALVKKQEIPTTFWLGNSKGKYCVGDIDLGRENNFK